MKHKLSYLSVAAIAAVMVLAASSTDAAKSKNQGSAPAIGDPVEITFTAVGGGKVDLASLKGKVVLVDFWATWCGPCVGEVPKVVAAYEKLHPKGFEIIGISLDSDKSKLTAFTKKNKMTWHQYFDGKGWNNAIAERYAIHSIPAMWLIDKEGKLASTTARAGLEDEVEKLLAK